MDNTDQAENSHMIEERKGNERGSSRNSSLKSSTHSDNYTTNKAEESIQKRKISGTQFRNRASEMSRHIEQEDEKEVPEEHPRARMVTESSGINPTNRDGGAVKRFSPLNTTGGS